MVVASHYQCTTTVQLAVLGGVNLSKQDEQFPLYNSSTKAHVHTSPQHPLPPFPSENYGFLACPCSHVLMFLIKSGITPYVPAGLPPAIHADGWPISVGVGWGGCSMLGVNEQGASFCGPARVRMWQGWVVSRNLWGCNFGLSDCVGRGIWVLCLLGCGLAGGRCCVDMCDVVRCRFVYSGRKVPMRIWACAWLVDFALFSSPGSVVIYTCGGTCQCTSI